MPKPVILITAGKQGQQAARSEIQSFISSCNMQYVDSVTHQHFHYLGFERYELRRPTDDAMVGGDHKTGFCLGDDFRFDSNAGGAVYTQANGGFCQQLLFRCVYQAGEPTL